MNAKEFLRKEYKSIDFSNSIINNKPLHELMEEYASKLQTRAQASVTAEEFLREYKVVDLSKLIINDESYINAKELLSFAQALDRLQTTSPSFPSDEEIEEEAYNHSVQKYSRDDNNTYSSYAYQEGFEVGVKWALKQTKNKGGKE